jgi:tetratricopeptide (TPR) repeat protein
MYLVETLTALGEVDEAMEVADSTLRFYNSQWTRFAEPNMLRLRGAALQKRGDLDGAERDYRRALAMAREDQSRPYELRAATSLAALLEMQPEGATARSELAGILNQLRDEPEIADSAMAKELLRRHGAYSI